MAGPKVGKNGVGIIDDEAGLFSAQQGQAATDRCRLRLEPVGRGIRLPDRN